MDDEMIKDMQYLRKLDREQLLKKEEFVTVGIGTNRMILAHQILDLIESKEAYTAQEALLRLHEIYGILIQITGRKTMAEKHPELIGKVVRYENPKLSIDGQDGDELVSSQSQNGDDGVA